MGNRRKRLSRRLSTTVDRVDVTIEGSPFTCHDGVSVLEFSYNHTLDSYAEDRRTMDVAAHFHDLRFFAPRTGMFAICVLEVFSRVVHRVHRVLVVVDTLYDTIQVLVPDFL